MSMWQQWSGAGRLTADPELKYTPSGVAVCTFTLAVDRPFKNGQGQQEADFVPVVLWRQLAETMAEHLRKGKPAIVTGRWQRRHYENNEGRKIYVWEVMGDNVRFLPDGQSRSNNGPGEHNAPPAGRSGQRDPFYDDGRPVDISDDDLPF